MPCCQAPTINALKIRKCASLPKQTCIDGQSLVAYIRDKQTTCSGSAVVLYVDPSNTPSTERDGSICSPFATIQDAMDVINASTGTTFGAEIVIAPGSYTEDIMYMPSNGDMGNVVLRAQGVVELADSSITGTAITTRLSLVGGGIALPSSPFAIQVGGSRFDITGTFAITNPGDIGMSSVNFTFAATAPTFSGNVLDMTMCFVNCDSPDFTGLAALELNHSILLPGGLVVDVGPAGQIHLSHMSFSASFVANSMTIRNCRNNGGALTVGHPTAGNTTVTTDYNTMNNSALSVTAGTATLSFTDHAGPFADDAAAAGGGVAVGETYVLTSGPLATRLV